MLKINIFAIPNQMTDDNSQLFIYISRFLCVLLLLSRKLLHLPKNIGGDEKTKRQKKKL